LLDDKEKDPNNNENKGLAFKKDLRQTLEMMISKRMRKVLPL
jgi:hypothetical protein